MMASSMLNPPHLMDIAGTDGLQVVQSLVGESVQSIAPFQSVETRLASEDCSVLRLGEYNFRLSWQGNGSALQNAIRHASTGYHAWAKSLDWMKAIVIPDASLISIAELAVVKPPHRLQGLATNRAVPVRIQGISVLIWRHPIAGTPALELHIATNHIATNTVELIQAKLSASSV